MYVLNGTVLVDADGHQQKVDGGQAVALRGCGSGERVRLAAPQRAHVLILSGAQIREPVISQGPFIMNDAAQIEDAVARYRTGAMGHLTPLRTY